MKAFFVVVAAVVVGLIVWGLVGPKVMAAVASDKKAGAK